MYLTIFVLHYFVMHNFSVFFQKFQINYVLDQSKPGNELIVKDGVTCITRSDFQTLGLKKELEPTVGNTQ